MELGSSKFKLLFSCLFLASCGSLDDEFNNIIRICGGELTSNDLHHGVVAQLFLPGGNPIPPKEARAILRSAEKDERLHITPNGCVVAPKYKNNTIVGATYQTSREQYFAATFRQNEITQSATPQRIELKPYEVTNAVHLECDKDELQIFAQPGSSMRIGFANRAMARGTRYTLKLHAHDKDTPLVEEPKGIVLDPTGEISLKLPNVKEGEYQISAWVTDIFGNQSPANTMSECPVVLDQTRPRIRFPENIGETYGVKKGGEKLAFSFYDLDKNLTTSWCAEPLDALAKQESIGCDPLDKSTWNSLKEGSVILPQGQWSLKILARDSAGNEAIESRKIRVDNDRPVITVTMSDERLNRHPFTLVGNLLKFAADVQVTDSTPPDKMQSVQCRVSYSTDPLSLFYPEKRAICTQGTCTNQGLPQPMDEWRDCSGKIEVSFEPEQKGFARSSELNRLIKLEVEAIDEVGHKEVKEAFVWLSKSEVISTLGISLENIAVEHVAKDHFNRHYVASAKEIFILDFARRLNPYREPLRLALGDLDPQSESILSVNLSPLDSEKKQILNIITNKRIFQFGVNSDRVSPAPTLIKPLNNNASLSSGAHVHQDSKGVLWIWDEGKRTFWSFNGEWNTFSNNSVQSIQSVAGDSEGNIFVVVQGTQGNQIARLTENMLSVESPAETDVGRKLRDFSPLRILPGGGGSIVAIKPGKVAFIEANSDVRAFDLNLTENAFFLDSHARLWINDKGSPHHFKVHSLRDEQMSQIDINLSKYISLPIAPVNLKLHTISADGYLWLTENGQLSVVQIHELTHLRPEKSSPSDVRSVMLAPSIAGARLRLLAKGAGDTIFAQTESGRIFSFGQHGLSEVRFNGAGGASCGGSRISPSLAISADGKRGYATYQESCIATMREDGSWRVLYPESDRSDIPGQTPLSFKQVALHKNKALAINAKADHALFVVEETETRTVLKELKCQSSNGAEGCHADKIIVNKAGDKAWVLSNSAALRSKIGVVHLETQKVIYQTVPGFDSNDWKDGLGMSDGSLILVDANREFVRFNGTSAQSLGKLPLVHTESGAGLPLLPVLFEGQDNKPYAAFGHTIWRIEGGPKADLLLDLRMTSLFSHEFSIKEPLHLGPNFAFILDDKLAFAERRP